MYLNHDDLKLLKININEDQYIDGLGGEVNLFGVYSHLKEPVIKFTSMSKKFLYAEDGSKHLYNRSNSELHIFTSGHEAWQFFKSKLKIKKNMFTRKLEMDRNLYLF